MDRSSLPLIAPQYEPHYISAKDVLNLLGYGKVSGVNYQDPRIQEIRSCLLSNLARVNLTEALKAGYLFDSGPGILHDSHQHLLTVWKWWCTAAGHPHIVLSRDSTDQYQITCNLISSGRKWHMRDIAIIGGLVSDVGTVYVEGGGFSISERVLELGGLEMDDALVVVRSLVDFTTSGKFKQRQPESLPEPDPMGILLVPHLPIERSDT